MLHCVAVLYRERVAVLDVGGAEKLVRNESAAVARELPSHKRPRSLQVTDQLLPRTSTRKLQRFKIRDGAVAAVAGVAAAPVAAVEAKDAFEDGIAGLIGRIRPGAPIGRETHLELDLHLDSLERVELLTNVEKAFGITVAPGEAAKIESVGDLIGIVRTRPGAAQMPGDWHDWTGLVRQPLTREEEEYAGFYLRRRAFAEVFVYGLARVIAVILRVTMRLRIRRSGEFPAAPFLLCPNHLSYLDDLVVAASLPFPVFRLMFGLAASKYFRSGIARWVAGQCRILPIDQGQDLLKGLRMAKAGCEKGLVLIVFPEGTRSSDGKLQELRKGTAVLACALNLPVVPAGIVGTFEAWPRGRSFPRPHPVAISFGEAIVPGPGETPEAFNERMTAGIRTEIQRASDPVF
jgi:long-chain acyl-CoA synthetase